MPENSESSITIESNGETPVEETPIEGEVQEQPPVAEPTSEEEAPPVEDTPLPLDDLQVKEKAVTVDDFFQEDNYNRIMGDVLNNGGKLTEENYAEFEKAGHSRALADRLLQGEILAAELRTQKVVATVGGAEKAQAALEWAANNLTEKQIAEVNKQLWSTDVDVASMAIQNLVARAGGSTQVTASTAATMGGHFADEAAFNQAMADPRVAKSAAYRAEVEAKLQRSVQMGLIKL